MYSERILGKVVDGDATLQRRNRIPPDHHGPIAFGIEEHMVERVGIADFRSAAPEVDDPLAE